MSVPRPRAALAVLCIAQFLDVLGVTLVVVALPEIGRDAGLSGGGLSWVVSVYALFFGAFLVLGGRAADLFGRRRVFVLGLAGFGVASAGCALASSAGVLLGFRALQGLGAALVVPAGLALVTGIFTERRARARALSVWTASAAVGGAGGFVVGGLVTDAFGWEWLFLMNLPLAAVALALVPLTLPPDPGGGAARRLDLGGAVLLAAGIGMVILGGNRAEHDGPGTEVALALALGALLLACFVALERRVADPLLPTAALRNRGLAASSFAAFCLTATTSSAGVLATLYLQDVGGAGPARAGLLLVPFSLAVVAGSAGSSAVSRRLGPAGTMAAGLGAIGLAMAAAAGIGETGNPLPLVPALAVAGFGLGGAAVASTSTGTAAASPEEQGMASGILNTATQLGTALGVAFLLTVASPVEREAPEELVAGLRAGYALGAALALLAAGLVLALLRGGSRSSPGDTA